MPPHKSGMNTQMEQKYKDGGNTGTRVIEIQQLMLYVV
jgi:hypothetical protein